VRLAAYGYDNAHTVARKFAALYTLCEERLPQQCRYDFGMRNVAAVLRALYVAKKEDARAPLVSARRACMPHVSTDHVHVPACSHECPQLGRRVGRC
jgi:hypothetical protein